MADDAAVFLIDAGQKAGHIFKRDERDVEAIAKAHEARRFDRCVDIQHTGEKRRLIGDNADRVSPKRAKPTTMFGA